MRTFGKTLKNLVFAKSHNPPKKPKMRNVWMCSPFVVRIANITAGERIHEDYATWVALNRITRPVQNLPRSFNHFTLKGDEEMSDDLEQLVEWAKQGTDQSEVEGEQDSPPKDTVPTFDELREQVDRLQSELNQRKIVDSLTAIARELRIPESIIEHDLFMFAERFVLQDGKPVSISDTKKSAKEVLADLQKTRPHWQPKTVGDRPTGGTGNVNWFTKSPY
jgi:hypothetical protein